MTAALSLTSIRSILAHNNLRIASQLGVKRRCFQCREHSTVLPQMTSETHPEFKRNPNFKELTDEDLRHFSTILPQTSILHTNASDTAPLLSYNTDWFKLYRGQSKLVLFPTSTQQVSQLLAYCNSNHIAVVPQGGNTGVSGGATPIFDEVIINTSKMNKIRGFDDISGVVVAEAGVILEILDQYLEKKGFTVPLDLGAKGSCQIGGNISTNAGGLRLVRWGSLRGSVLGVESVLADGTVLDNLSTLRKDNTGLDIKQLFIGSEGTLGVVTAVSILTPRRPSSLNVALLSLDSYSSVLRAFSHARADLSEILSAFEFWDDRSAEVVKSTMLQDVAEPISGGRRPFYALIETQGSNPEHDEQKLSTCLERLSRDGIVQDGVIAHDTKQIKSLWSWREFIPTAITHLGPSITYDVSLPLPMLYELIEDTRLYLRGKGMLGSDKEIIEVLGFGHIGDGNVHLMAAQKTQSYETQKILDDYVFEWTGKRGGSVSAEHGIGISKIPYLPLSKSRDSIAWMRRIKNVLDPNGILNPYKIFGY